MTTYLQSMDMSFPISSVEAYIAKVKHIPVLSAEEERKLAEQFYYHQDLSAARKLVFSNLRFVVLIAKTYKSYGLALADLIQEGNIGLMKAIKRFDPKIGVRLVSFSVHWIKAEIQEFILRNWRIVKIATTKAQRKLFFNLRKVTKKGLTWFSHKEIQNIAKTLDINPKTVQEMESRLSAHDVAFDAPLDEEESSTIHSPVNASFYLEDHRYNPALLLENSDINEHNRKKLQQALLTLDQRAREIIIKLWLIEPKSTLQELANYYQVSAERIRQVKESAMKKMRIVMEEKAD